SLCASLLSTRARCTALRKDARARSKLSCTREAEVLTCGPPGPEDRENCSVSLPAGMTRPAGMPGPAGTRTSISVRLRIAIAVAGLGILVAGGTLFPQPPPGPHLRSDAALIGIELADPVHVLGEVSGHLQGRAQARRPCEGIHVPQGHRHARLHGDAVESGLPVRVSAARPVGGDDQAEDLPGTNA